MDQKVLNKWSQWQGVHETGKLLTLEELKEHLRKIDRDVDAYMFKIGEISEE